MGVELVEGRDPLHPRRARSGCARRGVKSKWDVIYRRIDDDFLDPLAFRQESMLGVPGLVDVYRAGRVALANAIGTGIADDKAMYAYVPKIIDYYLSEEPILPNVQTYLGSDPEMLEYICKQRQRPRPSKRSAGAGGYGMLIGPEADEGGVPRVRPGACAKRRVNYIAQPVMKLSRHPTYYADNHAFEPCHVDLRPLHPCGRRDHGGAGWPDPCGPKTRFTGRQTLHRGGGSKDTWVLAAEGEAGVTLC